MSDVYFIYNVIKLFTTSGLGMVDLKADRVIILVFDVTTLPIHQINPESICQRVDITIQEALITMSNQSNYTQETLWGDVKGSFKKK